MLVNPGLARLASQVQYERCAAQIGLAGAASQRMFIRQFESEAYPRIARGDAWRDLLAQLQLRSAPFEGGPEVFAAASVRGDPHGLALGRLRAGLQTLSPLTRRSRLPIGLLPLEDDIEVEAASGPVWVPPWNPRSAAGRSGMAHRARPHRSHRRRVAAGQRPRRTRRGMAAARRASPASARGVFGRVHQAHRDRGRRDGLAVGG